MLKLKKIQILGFKSFCDRTEVVVPGHGIAAVVGPNGCGKSNILDGVSWVLGEQSARTLRGGNMQDVIFAGSRDRKPLGMAEVTLTLVDPDSYSGPLLDVPEVQIDEENPDWDEDAVRQRRAAEVEEIIAESQPGQVIEGEEGETVETAQPEGEASAGENGQPVVLRIRRRKFRRTPRQGEIVITRRLFRTGESEYLLNGKLCRLRDIQDIFMGTGLGPESYAIIGQERIGQLLSSKPHDRRAIIEEAAGITRFKTKKRLAELRLESSRQNLARVNDIFEEITKQMASLKRQAAKAERYGEVRAELRTRLRVVLLSRLRQMDAERLRFDGEIATLSQQIEEQAASVEQQQAEQQAATTRGYELENAAKQAAAEANSKNIELERALTRQRSNTERIADLEAATASGEAVLENTRQELARLEQERTSTQQFLNTAASEAAAMRGRTEADQRAAQDASRRVNEAESNVDRLRSQSMTLLSQANSARNQMTQAEAALASLDSEAQRLAGEIEAARTEAANLGQERGQVSLRFESATGTLKQLEEQIAKLNSTLNQKQQQETAVRKQGDQLRAEVATLQGRRNSLDALIREHSYSTDTVKKLLRSSSLSGGLKPVGTLADFLEVDGKHETVVDEFLREELNYIVVKNWDAANEGMRLLKSDVDGRATFLVHPDDSQALFSFTAGETVRPGSATAQDITPLKDCIRVLDGFGSSLEVILPKLRSGFVTTDTDTARRLALESPDAFFLSPTGECFHNVTVTGGKPRAEGPLALKRELRETDEKLSAASASLSQAVLEAETLARSAADLRRELEQCNEQRRAAERESANQGAALRQMDAEVQRIERRLAEWNLQAERNKGSREGRERTIEQRKEDTARFEADHAKLIAQIEEQRTAVDALKQAREEAQQKAVASTAELAGLEERRRGADATFQRIQRLCADLQQRVQQLTQQQAGAQAERNQRLQENERLAAQQVQLTEERDRNQEQTHALSAEAKQIRESLAELEKTLRELRVSLEQLREARGTHQASLARLTAELEHLEASTVTELDVEAAELRADDQTAVIEGEALTHEDEACRSLRRKLEAMGPVNMLALDEYKETSERHGFLETQRKDLLDSIENTMSTIKEIDEISRVKFDEAFVRINENFAATFTRLFNGGQAFMKLTDQENQAESGIDLVASPPGKKLQSVLLLSGGEKALTALSLLVGIFQYQPSPFCVLDEVDAPLDETNVGRLADLLRSMSHETQFIMVTHSKRMMQAADLIYGVTMQEPGVSKLVSVRIGSNTAQKEQVRATA